MMNRTTIENGNTLVEDFAAAARMSIGDAVELPMNAYGSVVKRFTVKRVEVTGTIVQYELEEV